MSTADAFRIVPIILPSDRPPQGVGEVVLYCS